MVRELRASDEWLGALYAPIACGVVVRGAAGEIIYANPAAEELLGLPAGDLCGQQPNCL